MRLSLLLLPNEVHPTNDPEMTHLFEKDEKL
jgi:hypothetical protein